MKIIIAGAGAVGTHLAKLLAKERHDITLIDEDPERLAGIGSNFDMLTVCAQPSSIATLREAETGKADLFIAVTPDEAHNMTCCMLASKLGAKKTVARVDNDEYVREENRIFFKSVGVDSLIYPELLAGEEIIRSMRHTWVRQWIEVQNGALLMIGVKVRRGATILNVPLRVLCGGDSPFHIVAVKRADETIIPHGDDSIEDGDVVYFMTTPECVEHLRTITGKEGYPEVKSLFVMGGSKTALHALREMPVGMHAKVFESDIHLCERFGEQLHRNDVMVLHGDGSDLDLLRDEGLAKAEAFAALTENSETNILACLAAKRMGVTKTVAMVENLDYVGMAESLDIGSIINKKTFAAGHIYRMMLKADVTTVKSLTVAAADVAEFHVNEGTRITKHPVKDLHLPETVTLGGLVRNGKGILIGGMTQILPGDTVVAFCLENNVKRLEGFFK